MKVYRMSIKAIQLEFTNEMYWEFIEQNKLNFASHEYYKQTTKPKK